MLIRPAQSLRSVKKQTVSVKDLAASLGRDASAVRRDVVVWRDLAS